MAERLLRTVEVVDRTGLGRTTLWRWEKEGRFPPRRRIGNGTVAWLESEVEEWIQDRPVAYPDSDPAG
jgi:prophage regulatory protein